MIKVCGVTTLDDARMVADAGAGMIGLNFYPKSPRYLAPDAAAGLIAALRAQYGAACPAFAGVFVNADPVDVAAIRAQTGLDFVQLHGDEPPDAVCGFDGAGFKAIRPPSMDAALDLAERYAPVAPTDMRAPSLLLDAYHPDLYGGSGVQASIDVARAVAACTPRLMLAGGLTPDNIADMIAAVRPWGVDVASGVEHAPGRKDADKVRRFVEAARSIR